MKVLILITKSNWGGAQRYVYDIATNLPKNEYEVTVMAGGNGVLIEKLISANINASGDLPIARDVKIWGDIKAFIETYKIIKNHKPDILHLNSSKIGIMGAIAGRIIGINKIIFTAHGWAFNENRSAISKLIIKFLHWFTVVISHKTISVSEALINQMRNWPMITNKMFVVHNGISQTPVFSKTNARFELGKMNQKFNQMIKSAEKNLVLIGSVGELHHIKGYEYAIEAVKNLIQEMKELYPSKKIVYCIISDGEDREKLEKIISESNLNDSVMLLGIIPNAYEYMRAFDIFLMPSLSEGLPYTIVEAGYAGLPVIASAVGGIPEIIEDMKSGVLIQPRKSKEIQHALRFYILHKKMQSDFAKSLNETVINNYTINKMISETVEVYLK